MSDRPFGMLCAHIGVTGLAMGHGFLKMLNSFIHMRIFTGRSGVLECLFSMLHQGIGMSLFSMRHSFLGMCQGFSRMLVSSNSQPAEQGETNERGDRRKNQCSADSHLHGSLLNS